MDAERKRRVETISAEIRALRASLAIDHRTVDRAQRGARRARNWLAQVRRWPAKTRAMIAGCERKLEAAKRPAPRSKTGRRP
jgi:hypothetical protein